MEVWRQDLYLAHHGILGMKWGRKNGPPYPLKDGDHSASEKKADWKKSLDSDSDAESEPDTKPTNHPDHDSAHTQKNVNEMSDAELRQRIGRLNMEQQLEKLTPKEVNKAKAFLEGSLAFTKKANDVMTTGINFYNNIMGIKKIVKEIKE